MAWHGSFALDGSANARDVGGMPTRNGGTITPGVLIRSANLQHLSADAVQSLVQDRRVRRVVDLRTDVEVRHEGPGPLNERPEVSFHHLSLYRDKLDADGRLLDEVTDEMAGEPDRPDVLTPWQDGTDRPPSDDPVVSSYLRHLHRRPDSVVAALRVIAEPDGATLVHCAAGKDRTGVVVALALAIAGAEPEAIFADYAETATDLPAVMDLLARSDLYQRDVAKRDEMPIPEPGVMRRVFAGIDEEFGGLDAYLAANGWTADDSTRLRDRLTR